MKGSIIDNDDTKQLAKQYISFESHVPKYCIVL